MLASGQQFSYTEDATTQATVSASYTLTGLTAATSYKVYFVLKSTAASADAGSVVGAYAFTSASVAPATWDTVFNSTNISYTNSNKTATRTDTTGNRAVRSAGPTNGTNNGLYYAEITVGQGVVWCGLFDSTVSTAGVGGTTGVNRVGWNGANATYYDGVSAGTNTAMGSTLAASDIVQIAYNRATKKIWIRKNGAGNWNNTVGADPNTGTSGFDASGMSGEAYLGVTLNTTASSTTTMRAASTDWTLTATGTNPATWATSANQWTS